MSMIPEKPPFKLLDILYKKEFILFVVLVSILIINSNISPYFLDLYNLIDSTFLFSEKAIIALTMTFVIIARQIDLSVASIIAVSSCVLGYTTSLGYDTWLVISLTLLSGALCGAFQWCHHHKICYSLNYCHHRNNVFIPGSRILFFRGLLL